MLLTKIVLIILVLTFGLFEAWLGDLIE